MNSLALFPIEPIDALHEPSELATLSMSSSALEIFTDFATYQPLVLEVGATALEAEAQMKKTHVNMKLIVDRNDRLVGILTSEDLAQQRLIKRVAVVGVPREDIAVETLMRPVSRLFALDYKQLCDSTVKDVVDTLQHEGLPHCLVVDHSAHQIRGTISARDIARRLHISLPIVERLSFVDIFRAING
jgi:CBS domain containing-hemolysin-like protein